MLRLGLLPLFQSCNYKASRNNKGNMKGNAKSNEIANAENESCPHCGGLEIILPNEVGIWECNRCRLVWAAIIKKAYFMIYRYNENQNQVK